MSRPEDKWAETSELWPQLADTTQRSVASIVKTWWHEVDTAGGMPSEAWRQSNARAIIEVLPSMLEKAVQLPLDQVTPEDIDKIRPILTLLPLHPDTGNDSCTEVKCSLPDWVQLHSRIGFSREGEDGLLGTMAPLFMSRGNPAMELLNGETELDTWETRIEKVKVDGKGLRSYCEQDKIEEDDQTVSGEDHVEDKAPKAEQGE